MRTIRLLLLIMPWIIIVVMLVWNERSKTEESTPTVTNTSVITEIQSLGKLELVKYNFKEITELKELSQKYFKIFQLGPDSKIALISEGQAVGCIDLTKISEDDINILGDSLFVKLPEPEICYYKLDMSKTRIYSLQTNPLKDEKEFIQKAYKSAEEEIKEAALSSGILNQTRNNGELILRPLLEEISGKTVIFTQKPEETRIIREN